MTLRATYCTGVAVLLGLLIAVQPSASQPVSIDVDPFRLNLKLEDQSRQVLGAPPRSNGAASFGLFFGGVWERITTVSPVEGEENVYSAITDRGTPLRVRVEHGQRISTVTFEGPPDIERIGYGFVPVEQEVFYAYVPGAPSLDVRGLKIDSRVDSSAVPFAMSSRGYGIALSGARDFQFDFASSAELFTFWADGASVSFRIYTDPNLNRIVERYTNESGRMGLPPTAQYGSWIHRSRTASSLDEALAHASRVRAYDVRASTYVLDRSLLVSASEDTSASEMAAATRRVVEQMQKAGYNVVANVWPHISTGASAYEEAASRGLLVADSTGAPILFSDPAHDTAFAKQTGDAGESDRTPEDRVFPPSNHAGSTPPASSDTASVGSARTDTARTDTAGVALIDFTHPEAPALWKRHLAPVTQGGVRGVVLNEPALPDSAAYHVPASGRGVWRAWRTAYIRSTREAFLAEGVKYPVIAGHVTDGGAARQLSLVQTAGWTADFDSLTGLPAAVVAAQQAGLSGATTWTAAPATHADTARADVPQADTVHAEAVARWIQFQAFSPSMQLASPLPKGSWLADPDIAPILRRYTRLHANLSSYLYKHFQEAERSGRPVIRPMATEVEYSGRTQFPDDQYYFGESVIVAPVLDTVSARSAYLPPGEWMHFWTLEVFPGDREVEVPVPMNEIPVFVRHDRDALNSLYRPLYKREVSSLATFLKTRDLNRPVPPVRTIPPADTAGVDVEDDGDENQRAAADDSTGSGQAPVSPLDSSAVSPPADPQRLDVTEEVRAFDLTALPERAPAPTAPSGAFRAYLDEINTAFAYLEMKQAEDDIAPVAARSLEERLTDLDRTIRAILSIIES